MALKRDVVKSWLRRLNERVDEHDGLTDTIADAAQEALLQQLQLLRADDFVWRLRDAADGADPQDLTEEERGAFRRLATALEKLGGNDSIREAVRERVADLLADLHQAVKPFRAWAERHGLDSHDDDIVAVRRDANDKVIAVRTELEQDPAEPKEWAMNRSGGKEEMCASV